MTTTTTPTPSNRDRLLSAKEAAQILHVSERTVKRWIGVDELAAHKLGRQWRIAHSDIDTFLRRRRSGGDHYVL